MRPEDVAKVVAGLPYMKLAQAKLFREFILAHGLTRCIELGFMHGVSSAYLAASLDEVDGHLTTIDLQSARNRHPNIEFLLDELSLSHRVSVIYEEKSFNWRLLRLIEEGQRESFDLCYLDGGHTLYDSGLAFFLVAELVAPGGWLVFDDLYFSFAGSAKLSKVKWVQDMPKEEQTCEQVNAIFSLLVERHPNFGNFRRHGRWGFAQKLSPMRSTEQKERLDRESAIAKAIERANSDLRFRNDLIDNAGKALQTYFGVTIDPGQCLTFEAADGLQVPGVDKVGNHYYLGRFVGTKKKTGSSM